jgi:2-(1,2-epoxy-1,2-dihydrophenyl)acetyl-CoA isomerase
MSYETLTCEVADGVATITLMRPDAANALNGQAFRDIYDAALECENDPAVRAVIITATGRMFCSGGDLKDFASRGDDLPRYLTQATTLFHGAIVRFQRMDAPVVIAVNGVAAGAGISFASCGDIVLASAEALFVSAYTASGLTPDGSATYFLAKHVGLMRAKELVLLNRRLTAQEACDWGLVTRVVPPERLMDEAREIAAELAKGATKAYGATKRLMLSAFDGSLETQLEREAVSIADMARTRDGRHGIETFAARGKPTFEGR